MSKERTYPLKSIHDFLLEINKEWGRFRTGTLLGVIASGALSIFFVAFFLFAIRREALGGAIVSMFVATFLVYTVYSLFVQYRFFSRWERRMALLLHLEERMLTEKLDKKN
jgi:O-antigen/teichoic acid export membrane protein